MRKVSLMLVAALLLSTGSIFANDSKKDAEPSKTQNLSKQIGEFLDSNNLTENHLGEEAQVLFMLNSEKEIVVLSVDTDREDIEGFIKGRLNYQEVEVKNYKEGKQYTISVRIAS
jgi:ribosomal protein L7Ae-like RNA K-turn-binding protein